MPDRPNDAREAARNAAETMPENAAERPVLTPQNRADPAAAGEDATAPSSPDGDGRAKGGQAGKAEGER